VDEEVNPIGDDVEESGEVTSTEDATSKELGEVPSQKFHLRESMLDESAVI
jgi:hypothetical protein